jgi:hypothetical protein
MSDRAWLKQVLADANVSNQSRPDWARKSSVQIAINSLSDSPPATPDSCEKKSPSHDGNDGKPEWCMQ